MIDEKQALLELLKDVEAHLEYIGWGDSWERSCAFEEKLPERLRDAIQKLKESE